MLMAENILPKMPPFAKVELNAFRNERLYCEGVDDVLKHFQPVLQALYSRWRLRPTGGGLRSKVRAPPELSPSTSVVCTARSLRAVSLLCTRLRAVS